MQIQIQIQIQYTSDVQSDKIESRATVGRKSIESPTRRYSVQVNRRVSVPSSYTREGNYSSGDEMGSRSPSPQRWWITCNTRKRRNTNITTSYN